MKKYLSNAISLNMLTIVSEATLNIRRISPMQVPTDCVSAIGHSDTARVVSGILGHEVPANRMSVELTAEDELYVAQYIGPRLPEGATELPDGAQIFFYEVTLQ